MNQTYTLKHPFVSANGTRIESVEIRRLNRGDLRKAHGYERRTISHRRASCWPAWWGLYLKTSTSST